MASNNDAGRHTGVTLATVIERLKNHWVTIPPGIQESFLGQTEGLLSIDKALQADPGLADYDIETYPELVSVLHMDPKSVKPADVRATLHLISSQVQLMENVFLGLRLAEHYAHPLNRGWMNLFRRWATTPMFRRCWPIICGTFSRAFVEFAECHLYVPQSSGLTYLQRPLTETSIHAVHAQLVSEWMIETQIPEDFVAALKAPYQLPTTSSRDPSAVWSAWIHFDTDSVAPTHVSQGELLGVVVLASRTQTPDEHSKTSLTIYGWIRAGYRDLGIRHELYTRALQALQSTQARQAGHSIEVTVDLGPDLPAHASSQHPKADWISFHEQIGFVRVPRRLCSHKLLYQYTLPAVDKQNSCIPTHEHSDFH